MPVYRISKQHRAHILNVTPEIHDKAQALIEAQRAKFPPMKDAATGETFIDPRGYLSWHDALRLADPETTQHPRIPVNIVDNGHHDHGDFHTMTVSHNVAKLLTDLGIELTFHHKTDHVSG